MLLYDYNKILSGNITIYSLETKIHISLINSYAPHVHSFFLLLIRKGDFENRPYKFIYSSASAASSAASAASSDFPWEVALPSFFKHQPKE